MTQDATATLSPLGELSPALTGENRCRTANSLTLTTIRFGWLMVYTRPSRFPSGLLGLNRRRDDEGWPVSGSAVSSANASWPSLRRWGAEPDCAPKQWPDCPCS